MTLTTLPLQPLGEGSKGLEIPFRLAYWTVNDDFYGGNQRQQDPMESALTHVAKELSPGLITVFETPN